MIKHRLLVAVFAGIALAGWSQGNEIIVESYSDGHNSQSFSSVQGKWTESIGKSTAPGLTATKAVYNDADAEAAVARFTPDIATAGKYEVFITYPVQGNATDIKYSVLSADGSKEIVLTQNGRDLSHEPLADKWHSLGVFNFTAGISGYVEVSDPLTGEHPLPNEPNARIYADAVKFVPADGAAPVVTSDAAPAAGNVTPAITAPVEQLPTLPAMTEQVAATPTATPADMPGLPAVQAAVKPDVVTDTTALPSLPPVTPQAPPVAQLPTLPAATPGAAQGLPVLPATDTAALPSLPAAAPQTGPVGQLPTLPAATPGSAQALPVLPATDSASAQTALPDLPSAPAPEASAGALPELPSAQETAVATPAPMVTAQATPYPVPDLPSLAPVTPTPERTMPSPADTPIPGAPTSMPGGALSNLPPAPAMPSTTDFAMPTPFVAPPAGSIPTPAAATTPAVFGPNTSITQYNPANLQWMYDYGAALNTARAQNKKVMVFFTAAGNKAANTYETVYFVDPSVRQALDSYVLIKVDFPKNTRLGYSLGIFGAGIIVVTNSAGDVTARITQLPSTPLDLVKQMAGEKQAPATATPAAEGMPAATMPVAEMPATDVPPMPTTNLPDLPPANDVPGVAPMPASTLPVLQ